MEFGDERKSSSTCGAPLGDKKRTYVTSLSKRCGSETRFPFALAWS